MAPKVQQHARVRRAACPGCLSRRRRNGRQKGCQFEVGWLNSLAGGYNIRQRCLEAAQRLEWQILLSNCRKWLRGGMGRRGSHPSQRPHGHFTRRLMPHCPAKPCQPSGQHCTPRGCLAGQLEAALVLAKGLSDVLPQASFAATPRPARRTTTGAPSLSHVARPRQSPLKVPPEALGHLPRVT